MTIYYVSQSATTTSDFQQVGHFVVRKFTQSESQVNLICEDRSQAELHKDLPLDILGDGEEIPDKYKGKPIPMVYGTVKKSPGVILELNSTTDTAHPEYDIVFDNTESATELDYSEDSPLYIYRDNKYLRIQKDAEFFQGLNLIIQHSMILMMIRL